MNRAERRRSGRSENVKMVSVKSSDLELIKKETDEVVRKVVKESVEIMSRVWAITLSNELGFSTKRINRVLARASIQFECIKSGALSEVDLVEWCTDKKIVF